MLRTRHKVFIRYINRDGQQEPEKVVTEYEGKLSQEELEKLAQGDGVAGMEVNI